ncbi:MAG: hypothetical protein R2800_05565 [Flavipsychrobacter sp.]
MFIRNNSFSDFETLLEAIYDFDLGEHELKFKSIIESVSNDIDTNAEIQEYVKGMDAEDGLELLDDIRLEQVAKRLEAMYDSFEIYSACFYGIKNEQKELLSELILQ